jgi:hypothetical protein
MKYIYTTTAVAKEAKCHPAYVCKLRALGVISPPQASDGTYLHSDEHIAIVRARVEAWRNRPRKAKP